ncbi:MAG: hypothetical protein GY950_26890 [bacterium]|nr:hypothetical protein [bacterium]
MIKKIGFLVLVLVLAGSLFSAKKGVLADVLKPDNIAIYGNELFVVEGATIYFYSLDNLTLTRKFGKRGEGPGELTTIPGAPTRIAVSADHVMAEGLNKIIWFSKDGKLAKEKKKTNILSFGFTPVGKHFVALKQLLEPKEKKVYGCVSLFDSELKEVKELYRQDWVQQGTQVGALKVDMSLDFPLYSIDDDKIFIEESPKGFFIEVFDTEGKKLYQIEKDIEKIPMTGKRKEELVNQLKEDPNTKAQGGWNAIKDLFTMHFPDYLPAVKDFGVSGGKIYVQTHKTVNGKSEYVVMDLKGKTIATVQLPEFKGTPIIARLMGAKAHSIVNGKLYYLQENEEEEEWELFVEEIK